MRKDKGFEVLDRINLYIANNEKLENLVKKHEEEIKHETLTDEVVYNVQRESYTDTNINGEHVDIDVEVRK